MRKSVMLIALALVLSMTACHNSTGRSKDTYNTAESDEIYIGVAYPIEERENDLYLRKGIEMALDTINASGGVLGKKLNAVIRDDKNDANLGMQIAQTFYEQGITAVIGHLSTNVCYYVEDIYEKNNVVMLTPRASGMNIFDSQYKYIFRICGNNEAYAQTISSYFSAEGYKRIAILYSDDEYGNDFAEIVEKALNNEHIKVIDRVTNITAVNIDNILQRWNAFGCEAIIMAVSFPAYMEPIRLIREAGSHIPIFGSDNFDYTSVTDLSKEGIDEIYKIFVPPDHIDPDFLKGFRAQYGHDPDLAAIFAYEAVFLIKDAIETAGTVDGSAIAAYLSRLENYETVSGTRTYNADTGEFDGFDVTVYKVN